MKILLTYTADGKAHCRVVTIRPARKGSLFRAMTNYVADRFGGALRYLDIIDN